eukprot:238425-Pyramimonas_sp.AAC.2
MHTSNTNDTSVVVVGPHPRLRDPKLRSVAHLDRKAHISPNPGSAGAGDTAALRGRRQRLRGPPNQFIG